MLAVTSRFTVVVVHRIRYASSPLWYYVHAIRVQSRTDGTKKRVSAGEKTTFPPVASREKYNAHETREQHTDGYETRNVHYRYNIMLLHLRCAHSTFDAPNRRIRPDWARGHDIGEGTYQESFHLSSQCAAVRSMKCFLSLAYIHAFYFLFCYRIVLLPLC